MSQDQEVDPLCERNEIRTDERILSMRYRSIRSAMEAGTCNFMCIATGAHRFLERPTQRVKLRRSLR